MIVATAAATMAATAGGCLQILGDEGPFVLGTGGTTTGGTGGSGATGGTGGEDGGTGGTTTVCAPMDTRTCYSGTLGTEGVGDCKAGIETCIDDGTAWGSCQGEVTPLAEDPKVPGDEACDGYAAGESLCAALFGDADPQMGQVVAATPDGNAIIAGAFSGAISFAGVVLVGQEQGFVAKIDAACQPLWATQLGGAEGVQLGSIAVDGVGDVYVSGAARSPFGVEAANVGVGSFVVKLSNSSGEGLWGTTCQAGKFNSRADAVAVDKNGSVAVGGSFSGSIDCGTGLLSSSGAQDAFIAMLDTSDGTPTWANAYGYPTPSGQFVSALAFDPSGNIVAAGKFEQGVDFGGGNLLAVGSFDIFVAKLTSAGQHLWSKKFGGPLFLDVNDIAIDSMSAVYVAGEFNGTIGLPGQPSLTNNGEPDAFIFKLSASGSPLWGWSFGPESGHQAGTSVDVAPDGNIVLTGWFEKSINLDGNVFPVMGSTDGFIAKLLGEDGSHVWSRSFKSSPFGGAAFTTDGTLTTAGTATASFDNTIDFGTGPVDPDGTDAFVLRLAP